MNATVSLATYLAALSSRADELLETHHQKLFSLGLDVNFNRATLATKYWSPLPICDEPTAAHDDAYIQVENDEQLFSALRECERILTQFRDSCPIETSQHIMSEAPVARKTENV